MTLLNIDRNKFEKCYKNKILSVKDKKLAEFNYKLIHNILPCNKNLKKWNKVENSKCRICDVEESIVHLVLECQFAKGIWNDLSNKTGTNVNLIDIIIGQHSITLNIIVSLISYAIFKEWVDECFNDKLRSNPGNLKSIENILKDRANIYKMIGSRDVYDFINELY